jgi:hypothetical protein
LTGQAIGGAVRGMGELAAQGGAVRGELAATVDHVQGVVQQRSTQGVADLLRGVAGLLPEEQRRHVEQMAGQLAHAGEQARIQQRAEAEATRRVAQDDAQQWRSQSQSLGDKIETHVRDSGRQIGEGIAVSGRRIDEQLDRGSQSLSQGVAQATQVGRVAGEGAGTVGVLVNRAAAEGVRVVAEQAAAHPSSYLHAKVGLPPSVAQAAPQASAPRAFSDPHHPQHALYNDLKSRLPAHISEDRLAQITAASHCGRVQAGRIDKLHVSESSLLVEGKLTGFANVDLTTPPPTQQHSLQQAQAYTQEQMERHQQLQQQRELQQEQHGPRMTLH